MNSNELILKQSLRETRETLAHWSGKPGRVLGWWALVSFGVAVGLLTGVYIVASTATADTTFYLPNVFSETQPIDFFRPLVRNSLVLALHAFVCIAGFMAMRALPAQVEIKSGIDRWIHHHASRFAMVWVSCATIFSIGTQIYVLGHSVADMAYTYKISVESLMLTVLPHAIPELTAVFLPLAAFLIASRKKRWNQLLAATVATVAAALPVMVASAAIEAFVWPDLLRSVIL